MFRFFVVAVFAFAINAEELAQKDDYAYKTCRVEEQVLKHGQVWTQPVYCIQLFCYDGFIIRILGCTRILNPGPGCHATGIQSNFDYPHCCPKIECNDKLG